MATRESAPGVAERLVLLQAELVEQAYGLERQGRLDAADVIIAVAGRVGELGAELTQSETRSSGAKVLVRIE